MYLYIITAIVGVLIAHFLSRAPELRPLRLSQLILVPCIMMVCVNLFQAVSQGFAFAIFFLAILLAPNIAYHCGVQLSNFLDRQDWTPIEEEIALRPIRRLIDKDNYREALAELQELLNIHKPTYEAVLLRAKLLHHIGRVDEAQAPLLSLIELSGSAAQQLAAMEMLTFLEEHAQNPPQKPYTFGKQRLEIDHELILFPASAGKPPPHKAIPPGVYEVEEVVCHNRRWLKLAGEDWGNSDCCWEAVLTRNRPPAPPPKKGVLWRIADMHTTVTHAIMGKSRRQLLPEAQELFKEASKLIQQEEWEKARPLLQKASACDPDRYEIAYRWMLAVRHTHNDAATAVAVNKVLGQSQWSQDEQDMLNQLKQPLRR